MTNFADLRSQCIILMSCRCSRPATMFRDHRIRSLGGISPEDIKHINLSALKDYYCSQSNNSISVYGNKRRYISVHQYKKLHFFFSIYCFIHDM